MKLLRTELTSEGRLDILERVMAYRGGKSDGCDCVQPLNMNAGYAQEVRLASDGSGIPSCSPSEQDRRKIEQQAFSGQLLGIVATNALELGVDIGVLDAVIMLGFPVSIASFVSIAFLDKAFSD
jgi:DEAD/DEAH box helicase domain-containing protein